MVRWVNHSSSFSSLLAVSSSKETMTKGGDGGERGGGDRGGAGRGGGGGGLVVP